MSSARSALEVLKERSELLRQVDPEMANAVTFQEDFNAQDKFVNFVYRRIKARNKDKLVTRSAIHIIVHGDTPEESLFVYPKWKFFQDDPVLEADDEISFGMSQITQDQCQNIYFTFPKSECFKRHLSLSCPQLDSLNKTYNLKLIPYRCELKDLNKPISKCTGNTHG